MRSSRGSWQTNGGGPHPGQGDKQQKPGAKKGEKKTKEPKTKGKSKG